MKLRNKLFSGVVACCLVVGASSLAHATNGYYMIATGASSLGMAGAVVAEPQDASTILQNPADIALLPHTTANVGGSFFIPQRSLNGKNSDSNMFVIPAAGFAVKQNPKGFTLGIGMYGVSGMGVNWSSLNNSGMLKKAYSNMQMMEMSIGGAWKVNDNLYVGFAPVFVYQALQMEFDWDVPAGAPLPAGVYRDVLDNAISYGAGFDIGMLYKVNKQLQIGAVYKSERWMEPLKWSVTPNSQSFMIDPSTNSVTMTLNMPRQIAAGINYHPIKPLRLELDVRWINYRSVMWEPSSSGMRALIGFTATGTPIFKPMKNWPFHWHNQWVFALGGEYQLNQSTTIKAGFNYAKDPIKSGDLDANIIAPAIVETHLTAGLTYKPTKHLSISGAYVYALPKKLSYTNPAGSTDQMAYGPKTQIEMHQNTVAIELSYNF